MISRLITEAVKFAIQFDNVCTSAQFACFALFPSTKIGTVDSLGLFWLDTSLDACPHSDNTLEGKPLMSAVHVRMRIVRMQSASISDPTGYPDHCYCARALRIAITKANCSI